MKLTKFTDYALRVLIFAAAQGDAQTTVKEVAQVYGISESHVKKVVHHLIHEGYLTGSRGRRGGVKLAVRPQDVRLGDVIRGCESDFAIFECMAPDGQCRIDSVCGLPAISGRALRAFLEVFDACTLADVQLSRSTFDVPGAVPIPGDPGTQL